MRVRGMEGAGVELIKAENTLMARFGASARVPAIAIGDEICSWRGLAWLELDVA